MRRSNLLLSGLLAALIAMFAVSGVRSFAAGPIAELEPNDTCLDAQSLGTFTAPLQVGGSLETSPAYPEPGPTPNVDYYRLEVTQTQYLSILVSGESSGGGTLADPLVAVYTANGAECSQHAFNDNDGPGIDAAIDYYALAVSEVVIAVTSCCDTQFSSGGPGGGTYTLSVTPKQPIGAVTGRVLDKASGLPIPPIEFFGGVSVNLQICGEDGCTYGPNGSVDAEGSFRIEASNSYPPLIEGNYRLLISASGYVAYQSPIFAVGANQELDVGTIEMEPTAPIGSLSGQVVNAKTGAPVPYINVSLTSCFADSCGYPSYYAATDEQGRFSFDNATQFELIYNGSYQLSVGTFLYQPDTSPIFALAGGESRDVGTLALQPEPAIGAITGRLVDAVSGEPLPGGSDPFANVALLSCDENGCYYPIISINTDDQGRFRFDNGISGLLAPGRYALSFFADQYDFGTLSEFTVAEGEIRDLGDVQVQPAALRLYNVTSCRQTPYTGGLCEYSARLVNNGQTTLSYDVWSVLNSVQPGSAGVSAFQPEPARRVRLKPGEAQTIRFRFTMPRNVANGTVAWSTIYVAGAGQGSYFNPLLIRGGFYVTKDAGGFRLLDGEEGRQLKQRALGAAQGGQR
jgi:5-hydroxyisourate hydrolase-like protein (transthyretin family)